jgi:OFA family oxalate/formate antiporter-like MFS transporter
MLFGIVIGIILILSGMVLSAPNKTASATKHNISDKDFTPSQMVSTVSFWLLIFWTILIAGLGLVVISQARSFLLQVDTTLSPAVISLMVGLISVCNGLGRLIFGAIYDSLDWRKTIFAICSVNILGAVVLFVGLRGSLILLVISFGLIGLGYGGAPTFNAAVAKRFYGASYYPINFPIINLNLLVSSFIPTLASGMLARSGNYSSISLLLIAMACVSILAALPLKKPNL